MNIIDVLNNEVYCTLAPSQIHRVGVMAIRDISAGTTLFNGEDNNELHYLFIEEFMKIIEPVRNLILDKYLQHQGNIIVFRHPNSSARMQCFMNHSDTPNSNGRIALNDIKKGEEVTENFIQIAHGRLHDITLDRMPFLMDNVDKKLGIHTEATR